MEIPHGQKTMVRWSYRSAGIPQPTLWEKCTFMTSPKRWWWSHNISKDLCFFHKLHPIEIIITPILQIAYVIYGPITYINHVFFLLVLRQFDDICMKSEKHYFGNKMTEITDVRPKFINTILYYTLRCAEIELTYLQELCADIQQSITKRRYVNPESNQESSIPCNFVSIHITKDIGTTIPI